MKTIARCGAIISLLFLVAVGNGQVDVSQTARAFFEEGDYLEGMNLLTAAINSRDPDLQIKALETFAKYQENVVGNIDYALRLYGNMVRTSLPDDHPLKVSAKEDVRRIAELKTQYRAEDVLLRSLQSPEIVEPDRRERQIVLLQSIADNKPDYYRVYEVYYHLGRHYLVTKDFQQSYLSFQKALELRPAINFYLPLNVYMERAHGLWIRSNVRNVTYALAGSLLGIACISFYVSRPWRWVGIKHLALLLSVALLWLVVFAASYAGLKAGMVIPDESVVEISATPPNYLSVSPGSPHWTVAENLFIYGLIGILVLFLFAIGTSRLRSRLTSMAINTLFACLFFAAITAIFYMHHCDQKSVFFADAPNGVLGLIKGDNYFVHYGMEPYILTNPKAYPNLAIENVLDPHLRQWIETYCPFDASSDPPGPSER